MPNLPYLLNMNIHTHKICNILIRKKFELSIHKTVIDEGKKVANKQAQCVDGDDGKKKRRSGGCGSERFTMWPKFYIFEVAFNFSSKFRYSEEAKKLKNLPILFYAQYKAT